MRGGTITLLVLASTTIYEVMVLYQAREGVPVDQQRFIFAGKQLQEEQTAGQCDIGGEMTIHAVLRLRWNEGWLWWSGVRGWGEIQ